MGVHRSGDGRASERADVVLVGEPPPVGAPPVGNPPRSGQTGADGRIQFVWRPLAAGATSAISVAETIPPPFEAESVTCVSGDETIFTSEDPATVASFTLTGLEVRDHIDCVVRNRFKRSTVQVVKQWVGDPSSATIFVDADGAAPVRRLRGRHGQRSERVLLLPGLDLGPCRRDRRAGRLRRDDRLRRRARSRTRAAPSRSPRPRPTAPQRPARSRTASCDRTCRS